ncbi:MAG: S9 family peptidase [Longimicrobiales bacterium]
MSGITTRCLTLVFALVFAWPVSAQTARTVSWADAAQWESLGFSTISADGQWIAYAVNRTSGDNEVRARRTSAGDSTRVLKNADQPAFARSGRWLAYRITVSEAERTRLQRANQPIRDQLGLLDLNNTAQRTTISEVQGFAFNHAGTHLAYRRYAPTGRKARGADLIVRDLQTGLEMTFGNVAEFAWQDRAGLLALLIDAELPDGNGLQLYDPGTGALRVLDSFAARYSGLTWRRKSDDLAALRTRVDSAYTDTAHVALAWKGLTRAAPQRITYQGESDPSLRVVNFRALRWSEDGTILFLGVKAREPKLLAKAADDSARKASVDEAPEVEVWHPRDVRPQLQQRLRLAQDRQANDLAAWHLEPNRLVRLSNGKPENLTLYEAQKLVLEADDARYPQDALSGRTWRDLNRVDLTTGQRTPLVEKMPFPAQPSPGGRYVLYMKDGHWWSRDLNGGNTANISAGFGTSVVDSVDDHVPHERFPYGIAGWTANDRSVIVYDRFDLWEVRPDGSNPRRLTNGAQDRVVHRLLRLDPEQTTIDLSRPTYLSLVGDWTKQSGLARLTARGAERLLWENQNIGRLSKAEQADMFAYVAQSYQDSPDLFVAGPTLRDLQQVSETNPFQKDYAWSRAELIEFTNGRGENTQAILNYPANYQPGRRYPMVVYIYERLTNQLHNYVVPSERSQYNISNFTQNGFFVLRPDITYVPREPGKGTIDGVVPAVKKVVEMGLVDGARVGVMGHSWGGYGTAFLATHTKGVFAAAIAGAALTNLVSFYGYSSENSGLPEHAHFEVGQERMEVSLWEDPQAYIRNSPIFTVHEMTTPLLIEHGDRDGNVDFGQGVELFNAARRTGKNVVMIVYNGENHGLARKHNQIDYARKQIEWFDHYLKGVPAAKWISDGVPYIERERSKTSGN